MNAAWFFQVRLLLLSSALPRSLSINFSLWQLLLSQTHQKSGFQINYSKGRSGGDRKARTKERPNEVEEGAGIAVWRNTHTQTTKTSFGICAEKASPLVEERAPAFWREERRARRSNSLFDSFFDPLTPLSISKVTLLRSMLCFTLFTTSYWKLLGT